MNQTERAARELAKVYPNAKNGKLSIGKTILTGFGFMAASIAWAIYDPYITKILNRLLTASPVVSSWSRYLVEHVPVLVKLAEAQGENVALAGGGFTLVPLFIGIIMTFDNIFGVIFQPTFGKLSDNCHSRLGKRRPFVVTCAPICAILFFLIPVMALKTQSLPVTMAFIILFVFMMSLWRAPVVALMPDLTPPALQSEGNAIINLMGGLGSGIGMVAGTLAIFLCMGLSGVSRAQIQADEAITFPYVFAIGAVVMVVGMLVLLFFVKEQPTNITVTAENNAYQDQKARRAAEKAAAKAEKAALKAEKLSGAERRSLIFMLLCLFFLFCASNAITTFFSLFAQEILHMITSRATIIMLIFAVVAAISAIPAGKMGKKLGRKKTIMVGLAVFMAAFVVFFGTFVGMLGKQRMSIGKYINVNNAYIAVNDKINAYNSDLSDAAKAQGRELEDSELLTMDGYIGYLTADDAGPGQYADFDAYLNETAAGIDNGIISVAADNLGYEGEDFGEALAAVGRTVKSVTGILTALIYPVLILGGAANMFITVNTLPLVLEIGGVNKVGTFTGYYYTATFSAQIVSPILYGFIRMFAGTYMSLFYYSPIMFCIAIVMIFFVHHGEPLPDEVIKAAQEAAD